MQDFAVLRALPVHVDLVLLRDRLAHFKRPIKKVFDLTQAGHLFALRRGHYLNLVSDDYRSVSLECLANTLYGPSYVSLEWALQYHGLIPERVEQVTSVTTRSGWSVKTPLGAFSYEHLNKNRYPYGYGVADGSESQFFIANPVKALLDLVSVRLRSVKWSASWGCKEFLHEDLRFDLERFCELIQSDSLRELKAMYHRNSKEARLLAWLLAHMERRV